MLDPQCCRRRNALRLIFFFFVTLISAWTKPWNLVSVLYKVKLQYSLPHAPLMSPDYGSIMFSAWIRGNSLPRMKLFLFSAFVFAVTTCTHLPTSQTRGNEGTLFPHCLSSHPLCTLCLNWKWQQSRVKRWFLNTSQRHITEQAILPQNKIRKSFFFS